MKRFITHFCSVRTGLRAASFAIAAVLVTGSALGKPPGRAVERNSRGSRLSQPQKLRFRAPALRSRLDQIQRHVQRDIRAVRNSVQRNAERVRSEIDAHRPDRHHFESVLETLFGPQEEKYDLMNAIRDSERPLNWPEPARRYSFDEPYPVPERTAREWRRQDAWAEKFEKEQRASIARRNREYYYSDQSQPQAPAGENHGITRSAAAAHPNGEPWHEDENSRASDVLRRFEETPPKKLTPLSKTETSRLGSDRTKPFSSTGRLPIDRAGAAVPARKETQSAQEPANLAHNDPPGPKKPAPDLGEKSHPYGIPVPGKAGMVYSPFVTDDAKYVDVRNIPSGTLVKDPYSEKFFRVP